MELALSKAMLERYRLSPETLAEQEPQPEVERRPIRIPLRLNRNFMNYPLARDVRTKACWQLNSEGNYWSASLPGDPRISFRLPAHLSKNACRLPTGLDMGVLFALLARSQHLGAKTVEFPTMASLLRACGATKNQKYRHRVKAALMLWSHLSIYYGCWWSKQKDARIFSPFLEEFKVEGYGLTAQLSPDCFSLGQIKSYFVPVVIPLPTRSATQNLLLALWTSQADFLDEEDQRKGYYKRRRRTICRKIGLTHKLRNQRLEHAAKEAKRWALERKGYFELVFDMRSRKKSRPDVYMKSGEVLLGFMPPPIPRIANLGKKIKQKSRPQHRDLSSETRPERYPENALSRPEHRGMYEDRYERSYYERPTDDYSLRDKEDEEGFSICDEFADY